MKTKLEIGDKIKRFEVGLTREIDFTYVIEKVTKTLAKSGNSVFLRNLKYGTSHPKISTKKIIARVYKKKETWSSPTFFLIEN